MSKKYRAGIIGCGHISQRHVGGYLASERFEVVALSDLHETAMSEMDQLHNISTNHYTDIREMLDKESLEVISVCTWHAGHAMWTIAAAAANPTAIICEKPMADTIGRAEEMMTACDRNNVKLVIGHQRRFLPTYELARKFIADGAIGNVEILAAYTGHGLPNWTTHLADLFRFMLSDDECTWVMGAVERQTDRYERNTRIEDRAIATFGFECGAQGLVFSDMTSHKDQGAKVYGSEGMLNVGEKEIKILNKDTKGTWKTYSPDGKFFKHGEHDFEYVESFAHQADELADWIEGKGDHRGQAINGYKALEMIHSIYESARCHEKVLLPLETRKNPLELMIDSGHIAVTRPGRYETRAKRLRGEEMSSDDPNTNPII